MSAAPASQENTIPKLPDRHLSWFPEPALPSTWPRLPGGTAAAQRVINTYEAVVVAAMTSRYGAGWEWRLDLPDAAYLDELRLQERLSDLQDQADTHFLRLVQTDA